MKMRKNYYDTLMQRFWEGVGEVWMSCLGFFFLMSFPMIFSVNEISLLTKQAVWVIIFLMIPSLPFVIRLGFYPDVYSEGALTLKAEVKALVLSILAYILVVVSSYFLVYAVLPTELHFPNEARERRGWSEELEKEVIRELEIKQQNKGK